jgi:hypothetical protein
LPVHEYAPSLVSSFVRHVVRCFRVEKDRDDSLLHSLVRDEAVSRATVADGAVVEFQASEEFIVQSHALDLIL